MLLNKKAVKNHFHDNGKRITKEALVEIEFKLKILLDKAIKASGSHQTVNPEDVSIFGIRLNI